MYRSSFAVFVLIAFYLLLCKPLMAQPAADRVAAIQKVSAKLDTIARRYAGGHQFPGFIYGLLVDGKLVHSFATGYANVEKQTPVTNQTCFRIASMSKSFTAMAILKLRDEGKLKLDDPVQMYVPEMLGQRLLSKDAESITIRHLLMHGAGFPEDNPWGDRQLEVSDQEMLDMIRKGISFSSVPGIAYEYSNMGYAMLGYIIKRVSGMPYQKYIDGVILANLGMKHTFFDYKKVDSSQLALGYRWVNKTWVNQPLLGDGAYGAMGGMITNLDDFVEYASFHQSVWPPKNTNEIGPVKRSTAREMHHPWNVPELNAGYRYASGRACPVVRSYGYGLGFSKDCNDRVSIGHSGGLPGFGSNWAFYPDYGIAIISFANETYAPASAFNTMLADTILAMTKLQPLAIKGAQFLEQRKNELVKLLPAWADAEASGIFAVNFFMDYFFGSLQTEATAIFKQAGAIKSIGKMTPENALRGSFILEGEIKNIEVFFTLTPENPPLIQEYNIKLINK